MDSHWVEKVQRWTVIGRVGSAVDSHWPSRIPTLSTDRYSHLQCITASYTAPRTLYSLQRLDIGEQINTAKFDNVNTAIRYRMEHIQRRSNAFSTRTKGFGWHGVFIRKVCKWDFYQGSTRYRRRLGSWEATPAVGQSVRSNRAIGEWPHLIDYNVIR